MKFASEKQADLMFCAITAKREAVALVDSCEKYMILEQKECVISDLLYAAD